LLLDEFEDDYTTTSWFCNMCGKQFGIKWKGERPDIDLLSSEHEIACKFIFWCSEPVAFEIDVLTGEIINAEMFGTPVPPGMLAS
jgi:hypothetical protein